MLCLEFSGLRSSVCLLFFLLSQSSVEFGLFSVAFLKFEYGVKDLGLVTIFFYSADEWDWLEREIEAESTWRH